MTAMIILNIAGVMAGIVIGTLYLLEEEPAKRLKYAYPWGSIVLLIAAVGAVRFVLSRGQLLSLIEGLPFGIQFLSAVLSLAGMHSLLTALAPDEASDLFLSSLVWIVLPVCLLVSAVSLLGLWPDGSRAVSGCLMIAVGIAAHFARKFRPGDERFFKAAMIALILAYAVEVGWFAYLDHLDFNMPFSAQLLAKYVTITSLVPGGLWIFAVGNLLRHRAARLREHKGLFNVWLGGTVMSLSYLHPGIQDLLDPVMDLAATSFTGLVAITLCSPLAFTYLCPRDATNPRTEQ